MYPTRKTRTAPADTLLPQTKTLEYRPDIDGLRAIAVLVVVIFHIYPHLLPGGFVGVDIFFVISGYLITTIIQNGLATGTFSFRRFYQKRIKRLFPALLIVMTGSWVAGWYLLPTNAFRELGIEMLYSTAFAANFHFWWSSNYFAPAADTQPLLHLWSLGVEEQFYLFWPLSMIVIRRRKIRMEFLIFGLLAASLAASVWMTPRFPIQSFFLPHTRLWELLIGASITLRKTTLARPSARVEAASWSGLLLLGVALFCVNETSVYPGWLAFLPTLGAALLISAGPNTWINARVLSSRPFVLLGSISYPLYLWHWPILVFSRSIQNGELGALIKAGVVFAAMTLASITVILIETPVRFHSANRPWVGILVSSLAVLPLALGFLTWQQEGFGNRFPEVIRDLANYTYTHNATDFRQDRCFLGPEKGPTGFDPICSGGGDLSQGIMLWGDSHAAALFQGLSKLAADNHFPIAQYTESSCPPIVKFPSGRPNCPEMNEFAIDQIAKLKPNIVIIVARWAIHVEKPEMVNFAATISDMRLNGAKHILVVGPVPNWEPTLPKLLLDAYKADPSHRLPLRLRTDSNNKIAAVDADMRKRAESSGASYFSPFDALCNAEGCLARLGGGHEDLMSFDYGHLTLEGSLKVIELLNNDPVFKSWLKELRAD